MKRPPTAAVLSLLLPLALLTLTTPATVGSEDDGLFAIAAAYWNFAHPPGFPLHVTIGAAAIAWLPLSPVYVMHLLSSIYGALTCFFVYVVARRLDPRVTQTMALAAGLAVAASPVFWSQTRLADVYTLHTLLLTATYAASLSKQPFLAATLWGLSMANHWPLALMASPLLWPAWEILNGTAKKLRFLTTALIAAAIPYTILIIRSWYADAGFYGPIPSLWLFVDQFLRSNYRGVDHPPYYEGLRSTLGYVDVTLRRLFTELTPVYAIAAVFYAASGLRHPDRKMRNRQVIFLGTIYGQTFFLLVLTNFSDEILYQTIWRPYGLLAYPLLAAYGACGLAALLDSTRRPALVYTLALATAPLLITLHGPAALRTTGIAHAWGTGYLQALPHNAILFPDGDLRIGVLGSLHFLDEVRPDLDLYESRSLIYPHRLFYRPTHPDAKSHPFLKSWRQTQRRRVFSSHPKPSWTRTFDRRTYGIFTEVLPGQKQLSAPTLPGSAGPLPPQTWSLIDVLAPWADSTNGFEYMHAQSFYYRLGVWYAVAADNPALEPQRRRLLQILGRTWSFAFGELAARFERQVHDPRAHGTLRADLRSLADSRPAAMTPHFHGNAQAHYLERLDDLAHRTPLTHPDR